MDSEGRWITLDNGIHIFIKSGQSTDEAIKEFTDKQEQKKTLQDKSLEELKDTIKLTDEQLPRSVGAKWKNNKIKLLDGTIGYFLDGSKLQDKEIIAGKGVKRKIDDINRLVKEHPETVPEDWMKLKAKSEVVFPDGTIAQIEIHWYESEKTGKIEFKEK